MQQINVFSETSDELMILNEKW